MLATEAEAVKAALAKLIPLSQPSTLYSGRTRGRLLTALIRPAKADPVATDFETGVGSLKGIWVSQLLSIGIWIPI